MAKDLTQHTVSSQTVYTGPAFEVRRDQLRLADGTTAARDIIVHCEAVVIIPRLPDGRVILVRQWRQAAGAALWEFPAGTFEAGENAEECATRELQEEAGYKPGRLTRLGNYFSAPGFCTELLHCYLAENLEPSVLPADSDEDFEVISQPLAEVHRWARAGRLRDAKTLAALLLLTTQEGAAVD